MADNPRIEILRRRVRMDPASIAFAELAEAYRQAGRLDDAIETCRAGLTRHPSYAGARITLGRALLDAGRFDEAAGELEHVLQAAPENLGALRALADLQRRREGPPPEAAEVRALQSFLEAIQTARRPGHPPVA